MITHSLCVRQILSPSHWTIKAPFPDHYHHVCGYEFNGFPNFERFASSSWQLCSWQISSPLPKQSQAIVILQEEGWSIGGGGLKAALQNVRCRSCPWTRHGQQRKWAEMQRWCAGHALQWPLRDPDKLCRGLQDGRGQLQVQGLHWGEFKLMLRSRRRKTHSSLGSYNVQHFSRLNSCCALFVFTYSYQRTMKSWLTSFSEGTCD